MKDITPFDANNSIILTIGGRDIVIEKWQEYPLKYLRTPKAWATVEYYATLGLKKSQIALCMGIEPAAFSAEMKRTPELSFALRKGEAIGVFESASALKEQIKHGSTQAIMSFLKTRDAENWTEKQQIEHRGPPISFKFVMDGDTPADGKSIE